MKKGDVLVILTVLILEAALVVVFFASSSKGGSMVIELNNELVYNFSFLGNDVKVFEIQGNVGKVVVIVENGRARFSEAECPDRTCVKTGWISRTGQAAACIPNGILIRIEDGDGGPDVVLR